MQDMTPLPWHTTQWEQLRQARQRSRLTHALLLVGNEGLGKNDFAHQLAAAVLCKHPNDQGYACGQCHACRLFQQASHPDFLRVAPEEAGKSISVDAIRDLVHWMSETTLLGGYRVVIVTPANKMNMNAANALLKTLEEPTSNTLVILISDHGLRMPATIVSRCQQLIFHKPSHADAVTWLQTKEEAEANWDLLLQLAEGAPLKAWSLKDETGLTQRQNFYSGLFALAEGKQDPITFATQCQEGEPLTLVDWTMHWITDVLRYQVTQDTAQIINADFQQQIAKTSTVLAAERLHALASHLRELRAILLAGISLNKQLVLEDMFIRWVTHVPR